MATEFDNSLHWGFFLTGTTLTSETGKYVRVSELVLSALRAAGVFSNMVDGIVAPATDKLWLDKNFDPAVLKEWDATGASWVPMTYGRLFGRAAVDKLTVTGGTGNAVVVSQPAGFQADRLYLMTPTADNSGAATINVSGVGTYAVKYGDGADIGPNEFKTGRQAVLFFTGTRFEAVFPLDGLSTAVIAAQASADSAAASALLSQKYAANPEDVEVTPGLFSAFHWYRKSLAIWTNLTNTVAGWIHGSGTKAVLVDADEFGIADSEWSWSLSKVSWANIKAGIASATMTLTNKTIQDAASVSVKSTSNGPLISAESTDAGSTSGPQSELYRNSASPAANDFLGKIIFSGNRSDGTKATYSEIGSRVSDPTLGSVDSQLYIQSYVNNALSAFWFGAGMWHATTGVDPGTGKLNMLEVQQSGTPIRPLVKSASMNLTGLTAVDFTSIPSWAVRVTIALHAVQPSGTDNILVQVGDAGGGVKTSGYASASTVGTSPSTSSAGHVVRSAAASKSTNGTITLERLSSTNDYWVSSHAVADGTGGNSAAGGGSANLAATLDRVRFTLTGANTFSAGTVGISWE
ncbi:hypothetical protein [Aminobacter niigataensis]|uniref:hypothetical protein n=1 Tax=Aminobacter niigataensis TaxID=83265 RepID=UPI0024C91283|nr:hypothetical protein [Aminobacter niigataensis]CAI2936239.1 protein of unknown function [Aminobacter niigataensis]